MKKKLLSTLLLFAVVKASLASSLQLNENVSVRLNINTDHKKDDCVATRSSTASGIDCWGNPYSIQADCTISAADCETASTQAAACAFSKAQLASAAIFDECTPN